jgi:hypothetical protein
MTKSLLSSILLFSVSTKAQLGFNLKVSNEISPVLSKVIHDYPNYFNNIKGDILENDPQITNYTCLLNIKDMEPGIITQYGRDAEHQYSWSNVLLQTESFDEAKRKFHLFYADIKKTSAIIRNTLVKLNANYEEPDENKNFCNILFNVEPDVDDIKNLVVDLNMQYEMGEWKIIVSFYKKEDEEKIYGSE